MSDETRSVAKGALGSPANQGRTMNSFNVKQQVYVNTGCWQGGRTDFALICENYVAACTWGNFKNETAGRGSVRTEYIDDAQLLRCPPVGQLKPKKMQDFLNEAQKNGRGFPIAAFKAPKGFQFSAPEDLLIFFGDTHIHLFREWICDNFVKEPAWAQPERDDASKAKAEYDNVSYFHNRESLAADLADFLKLASRHAPKKNLFQLGDLYEIWEVQALFEIAYGIILDIIYQHEREKGKLFLLDEHERFRLSRPSDYAACMFKTDYKPHRALPVYLGIHEFGLAGPYRVDPPVIEGNPQKWSKSASPKDALALLYHRYGGNLKKSHEIWRAPYESFKDRNLDFTDRSQVIEAIEYQYPELEGLWDTFTKIHGNHDTIHDNPIMQRVFRTDPGTDQWKDIYLKIGDLHDRALTSRIPSWNALYKQETGEWVHHDDPEADLPHKQLTGAKAGICYEHGHAFDPFNNDPNHFRHHVGFFTKPQFPTAITNGRFQTDGGYVKTLNWVRDELLNPTGFWQGVKGKIGQDELVKYADERMEKIFEKQSDVRLAVFGHTHVATVRDFARQGRLRLEQLERQNKYYDRMKP